TVTLRRRHRKSFRETSISMSGCPPRSPCLHWTPAVRQVPPTRDPPALTAGPCRTPRGRTDVRRYPPGDPHREHDTPSNSCLKISRSTDTVVRGTDRSNPTRVPRRRYPSRKEERRGNG